MLAVSFVQIICSIGAGLLRRADPAMGFGRDVRARSSTGSARSRPARSQRFGAPSLITRNTNDVTAGADAGA